MKYIFTLALSFSFNSYAQPSAPIFTSALGFRVTSTSEQRTKQTGWVTNLATSEKHSGNQSEKVIVDYKNGTVTNVLSILSTKNTKSFVFIDYQNISMTFCFLGESAQKHNDVPVCSIFSGSDCEQLFAQLNGKKPNELSAQERDAIEKILPRGPSNNGALTPDKWPFSKIERPMYALPEIGDMYQSCQQYKPSLQAQNRLLSQHPQNKAFPARN